MPRAQGAGTRVRAVPADARGSSRPWIVLILIRRPLTSRSTQIDGDDHSPRDSHSVVWVGSKHGSTEWQVIHI